MRDISTIFLYAVAMLTPVSRDMLYSDMCATLDLLYNKSSEIKTERLVASRCKPMKWRWKCYKYSISLYLYANYLYF
ncbi:hypothetical protein TUZN_0053 [Thermoproteus uzoniensis 768-20]|uniref:Uncharacterized protein n=1 Tax=Thermoproteus uzoniensis (strain 768-20) TaxID=999630 RepID=F2L109_THEU7|nr:hypothetical protein TUZN_0053 [Thermoproteus uzoniensis 768-20]